MCAAPHRRHRAARSASSVGDRCLRCLSAEPAREGRTGGARSGDTDRSTGLLGNQPGVRELRGNVRTRRETAVALHTDILDSLATDGFDRIFVINHQGDIAHNQMLLEVVNGQHEAGRSGVVLVEPDFIADRLGNAAQTPVVATFALQPLFEGLELSGELGVHAEEIESALMMRWFPETVNYEAMAGLEPTALGPADLAEWRKGGEHARRVTPQGFFGAPSPRDPFLWRFHERMARAMAGVVISSLQKQPGEGAAAARL
ncbi:creatininase family protein [Streptomyces sp. ISL-36]|nr:creatininase family protein [Streptomyces sp. ISL-36]